MHPRPAEKGFRIALLAALAGPVAAQPVIEAPEPLPRYHVELIIFANTDADPGEEWFAHERTRALRETAGAVPRPVPRIVGRADGELPGRDTILLDNLTLDELIWTVPEEGLAGVDADPATAHLPIDANAALDAGRVVVDPNALLEDVLPGPGVGLDTAGGQGGGALSAALDEQPEATEPALPELDVEVRTPTENGIERFRFRLLDESELQLGSEYARLSRLSAYEPLLHGGWVQEGLPENGAQPFNLVYLGATNPRGTVQLHLSRFLHVTLDLDYEPPDAVMATLPGVDRFRLGEIPLAPRYSLETQRRLRSGELHYIDHPMFGVLVLVTPAPEPEPSEPGAAQTPAA